MLTQIYKSGQGKYTRLCSGFVAAIIVAFGCWRLYGKLGATDMNLWVVSLVPVAVFVGLAVLIYWLLNKPAVADFLIAAEGELKKVNWSSRREVAVSTLVVIIVVVLMAALLGTTDLVFQMVFEYLLS
ncbi:MAG: preprotein translocase subunit SecE [Sedimentisphaerales bacterium]|jgi:preprotein translocase SecE subunit|nr:preprotein translocase subunit SecE [Sedimentisphaerales bacterium]NLZ06050.1 preprotein translocase subunit SecE [Phycisphaerae bacterium]HNY77244.1 preprotein translocase subunit SecE [Sedimentisphaerales bacterium]HOC62152.1 preprotein translocase subunit SecE [Sedimentisphaerales bacterium]HOH63461.1 preprotein translocase subunit SecE [Sedimentisphaerales bacterium]